MGWASGSALVGSLIGVLRANVPDGNDRHRIYLGLIAAFEEFDWDTQDECLEIDPEFDAAMRALHPDWDWDR